LNPQDVLKQANATFTATVKDILGNIPLPPGVKLPELKLPPLNVSRVQECRVYIEVLSATAAAAAANSIASHDLMHAASPKYTEH
jgi:hypothetical protein